MALQAVMADLFGGDTIHQFARTMATSANDLRKQQEVANQLKQNLPTTKSQIQRARKLIAQGFMDCCGFVLNKEGNLVGEIKEKEDCKVCK